MDSTILNRQITNLLIKSKNPDFRLGLPSGVSFFYFLGKNQLTFDIYIYILRRYLFFTLQNMERKHYERPVYNEVFLRNEEVESEARFAPEVVSR